MKIDVVICTFNQAELLDRTLNAVAKLHGPQRATWAVTVVNNHCTDHTEQVIASHRRRGRIPELRMVYEPKQGLTEARWRGVQETDGRIIALLDDDCLPREDWLCELAAFVEDHERAGVIGSRVKLHYLGRPTTIVRRHERALAAVDWGDEPTRLHLDGDRYLVGAGLCMRRTALEAAGWIGGPRIRDRQGGRLSSGGDTEMVYRILRAGYEAWYVPTMTLEHLIPAERCEAVYLERLYDGFGFSSPFLQEIANGRPWTARQIHRELRHSRRKAKRAKRRTLLNRLIGREEVAMDWRMKQAEYRGKIAAWNQQLHRPNP